MFSFWGGGGKTNFFGYRDKPSNFRVFGQEVEMLVIHKISIFRPDFLLWRERVIALENILPNSCIW